MVAAALRVDLPSRARVASILAVAADTRADAELIGTGGDAGLELRGQVRGQADQHVVAHPLAHARNRLVVLAHMHAVGAGRQRQVGPVVDPQQGVVPVAGLAPARGDLQQGIVAQVGVAQLKHVHAPGQRCVEHPVADRGVAHQVQPRPRQPRAALVAGLREDTVDRFVAALTPFLAGTDKESKMTENNNPLGLNGFEFVEFTSPDPDAMARQFEQLGFVASHRHPTKNITRYRQGRINLMLNRDADGRVAGEADDVPYEDLVHQALQAADDVHQHGGPGQPPHRPHERLLDDRTVVGRRRRGAGAGRGGGIRHLGRNLALAAELIEARQLDHSGQAG